MEAKNDGLQALMRDGLVVQGIAPFRADDKPRAVWPQGLDHLTAIAKAIDRATLWPFVATLVYRLNGQVTTERKVVEAPASERPEGEDLIPAGAEYLRADVMPAARFDDMRASVRGNYTAEYRAYLMWCKAKSKGKTVAQLVAWEDYDPISTDGRVHRWTQGACRVTL